MQHETFDVPRSKRTNGKSSAPPKAGAPELADGDLFGIMGFVETPAALTHACAALREAGYENSDAHTPFPVHGLEKAMGLRPSRMPWIVLGGATFGFLGSIALAWFTQVADYPQNISGKPPIAFQAYVPVFFELTVLCAG